MPRDQNVATYDYIRDVFAEEDDVLQAVRAEGEKRFAGMQITAAEGKLLQTLVRLTSAKRILEIGTFVGYSSIWMARALPDDGEVISLEFNVDHAKCAKKFHKNADLSNKIEVREGLAQDLLKALQNENPEPFDMVFIDASKLDYMTFLELSEPMLREGGLMIGDNTLLFGAMAGEPEIKVSPAAFEAMTAFNKRLADKAHYEGGILLPTIEGMTIAIKNTKKR